jgi:hypothetical protein
MDSASASASSPETDGEEPGSPPPARMTTVSHHYFGGASSERDHALRVDIVEVRLLSPPSVTPASPVVLVDYTAKNRRSRPERLSVALAPVRASAGLPRLQRRAECVGASQPFGEMLLPPSSPGLVSSARKWHITTTFAHNVSHKHKIGPFWHLMT